MNTSTKTLIPLSLALLLATGCAATDTGDSDVDTGGAEEDARTSEDAIMHCPDGPGTCEVPISCSYGTRDCDFDDVCETSIFTSVSNCGACGNACPTRPNASRSCQSGACSFTCLSGFSNCDGNAANGCETAGSCPVLCAGFPNDIDPARELVITADSVIKDPVRTTGMGAWTFGRLMTDMAQGRDVQLFVKKWIESWKSNQTINGFTAAARPNIQSQLITPWQNASAPGALDLSKAPFRLVAIVNRIDLHNPTTGQAAEGRFVFAAVSSTNVVLPFTVIFEYKLPITSARPVQQWAKDWHALGAIPFGSTFNSSLQTITDRFAGPGAVSGAINGSAISQVRTNELAIGNPWELREFKLSAAGMLEPAPVALTPNISFNGTTALRDLLLANQAAVLAGTHQGPIASMLGAGAPVPSNNTGFKWAVPGVTESLRASFSKATCNGCHAGETGTAFLHIDPRTSPPTLSPFLVNTEIPARRAKLASLACGL